MAGGACRGSSRSCRVSRVLCRVKAHTAQTAAVRMRRLPQDDPCARALKCCTARAAASITTSEARSFSKEPVHARLADAVPLFFFSKQKTANEIYLKIDGIEG